MADFNNDGNLGIATANYFDDTVSVLLGNGNGSFEAGQYFFAGAFMLVAEPARHHVASVLGHDRRAQFSIEFFDLRWMPGSISTSTARGVDPENKSPTACRWFPAYLGSTDATAR